MAFKREKDELEKIQPEKQAAEQNKSGKRPVKFMNNPKFKHGALATSLTAGFVVIIILVNVVVGILGERFPSMNFDMTQQGTNTLSEDALSVIDGVDQKTELFLIYDEQTAEGHIDYSQLAALMKRIDERNGNITFQFMEPTENPGFMADYADDGLSRGDVLVRTEKRYRVVKDSTLFPTSQDTTTGAYIYFNDTNAALANAISAVNSDAMPVVAVDTGHNEGIDVKSLSALLEKNNFEFQEFNLLTDDIPEKTQLILLPGPTNDLTKDETKKINDFLNDDKASEYRNLLVLYSPQMASLPNLATLMNEWGLDVGLQSMMMAKSSGTYVQSPEYLLGNVTEDVDFKGKTSYGYLLAPYSCPVDILWNGRNEITTTALMTTPSDAEKYVYNTETNKMELGSSGQANVIAMGTKMIRYDVNAYRNSNVVAVGCGLFTNDSFLNASAFSNADYITDLFKYLTNTTGTSSAVASNKKEVYAQDIAMNQAEIDGWGLYTFMIGIPAVFLIGGVVVFLKRRHL